MNHTTIPSWRLNAVGDPRVPSPYVRSSNTDIRKTFAKFKALLPTPTPTRN